MKIIDMHSPVYVGQEWTKINSKNFPLHQQVFSFIRNLDSVTLASAKKSNKEALTNLYNSLKLHNNEVMNGIVFLWGQKDSKENGIYANSIGLYNFQKCYDYFKSKHKGMFNPIEMLRVLENSDEISISDAESKKQLREKLEAELEAKNEKIRKAIIDRINNSVHSHKIKRYAEIYKVELGNLQFTKKLSSKEKSDCVFILKMIRYYFPKFPPIEIIDEYFIENVKAGILQKLASAYTGSNVAEKDTIEIEKNAIAVYCTARIRHYMTDYDKLMDAEIKKLGEENKFGINQKAFFRMMLPRIESIKTNVRKQVQKQVESIAKEYGIVFYNKEETDNQTSSPTSSQEEGKSAVST